MTGNEDMQEIVESLILSQEGKPGSHKSGREIAKNVGVSRLA